MTLPDNVKIYEVGPRDGLQNEAETVPTATKVALIGKLAEAGLSYIEATAFVSPQWVPQMADHAEVMQNLTRLPDVTYSALVPNEKGMTRYLESRTAQEVAVFTAASETFCQKNINASIAESIERFAPVLNKAREHDIRVRGYVSCIAGCPYESEIAPAQVVDVAAKLYEAGCYEISLGDTIGVGTPGQIEAVIDAVAAAVPRGNIALHCHDTYGQALVNIYAGLRNGITVFDSSVAGLGGCPYAPGASGNVATEDVVYLMNGLGIETGIDLEKLVAAGRFITNALGRTPGSKVSQALEMRAV